jgi:Domain of unknown function (DUF5753)
MDKVFSNEFAGFENDAARISVYMPLVLPGLLQTPAYMKAQLATGPWSPRWRERALEARLRRQQILDRADVAARFKPSRPDHALTSRHPKKSAFSARHGKASPHNHEIRVPRTAGEAKARAPVVRITTVKFVAPLIHRGRRLRTASTSRLPARLLSSIHSRSALGSQLLTEPVTFPQLVHRERRSSVCRPDRRA